MMTHVILISSYGVCKQYVRESCIVNIRKDVPSKNAAVITIVAKKKHSFLFKPSINIYSCLHIYGMNYISEGDSTVMTHTELFGQIELQIDHPTQLSQWVKNPKP